MVYQPQVDLITGEIVGAEALLRWHDPTLGDVSPDRFIPVAESCGLMALIGHRVFELVLSQIASWENAGIHVPQISVNISAHQLRDIEFATWLNNSIRAAGVDHSHLVLEITESALMERIDLVRTMLTQLQSMGISFSIDDFGTGYSSLAYLRRLPIHEVKIDRSFVDGLETEPDDQSITKAVINMAHALGMRVVAEGVETHAQREILRLEGCNVAQGFHFFRPLPPEDFVRALTAGNNPDRRAST